MGDTGLGWTDDVTGMKGTPQGIQSMVLQYRCMVTEGTTLVVSITQRC